MMLNPFVRPLSMFTAMSPQTVKRPAKAATPEEAAMHVGRMPTGRRQELQMRLAPPAKPPQPPAPAAPEPVPPRGFASRPSFGIQPPVLQTLPAAKRPAVPLQPAPAQPRQLPRPTPPTAAPVTNRPQPADAGIGQNAQMQNEMVRQLSQGPSLPTRNQPVVPAAPLAPPAAAAGVQAASLQATTAAKTPGGGVQTMRIEGKLSMDRDGMVRLQGQGAVLVP